MELKNGLNFRDRLGLFLSQRICLIPIILHFLRTRLVAEKC